MAEWANTSPAGIMLLRRRHIGKRPEDWVKTYLDVANSLQSVEASMAEKKTDILVNTSNGGYKYALLFWMLLSHFSISLGLWRWLKRDGAWISLPELPRKFWPSFLPLSTNWMAPQSRPLRSVYPGFPSLGMRPMSLFKSTFNIPREIPVLSLKMPLWPRVCMSTLAGSSGSTSNIKWCLDLI